MKWINGGHENIFLIFSSRWTRGQPSQRIEQKAPKCETKCVVTQPNTDQEQYNTFIAKDISLQMWQTELSRKEASEVMEMTVTNLIFICLQQHGSKLHPLHVPNVIKIHPISQVHYDITVTLLGQDSSHITLADSLFTCPTHLCHWHMSTSVYHAGLASDNIKPPYFVIIFIWT